MALKANLFVSTIEKSIPVLEMLPSIKIYLHWGWVGDAVKAHPEENIFPLNFLMCYLSLSINSYVKVVCNAI